MPDYRPISRSAYCGDDHWRATVEVTDGANRSEVQANIDLNPSDGTANPQMTLPNGTVVNLSSNAAFVTAFRELDVPSQPREESQRICSAPLTSAEAAPPEAHPTRSPWWLLVPLAGGGFQYTIDRVIRHDLDRIPSDHGWLEDVGNWGTAGSQGLFVASYIPIHRRLGSTPAWVADGVCMAGGLGFGIASAVRPHGEGTPELSMALTLGTTCTSAMIYGHHETSREPLRFWLGFGSQLVWGGLGIGLGAGGVGRRETPSGSGIYAPPGSTPGSSNDSNPYRQAAFPNLDNDLLILGIVQASGAVLNLADYLLLSGPDPDRPRVSVAPIPGGGVVTVGGTF